MKRKILVGALISALGAVTLASNCDEVTTVPSKVTVVISVSSRVIATGDTLAGDTVQFAVQLIQDSVTVPAVGRFSSDDPTIVEIIDENTGEAAFTGLGTAMVSVEVDDESLSGSLTASMKVNVVDFNAFLEVDSRQGNFTQNGDTLVSDNVTITAKVVIDGVTSDVVNPVLSSSDMSVIQTFGSDSAVFADTGTATVTVRFTDPVVPEQ
ncbi:MAG: hypothetical protein V3U63_03240, partial [Gemmatimonadota bacterium]